MDTSDKKIVEVNYGLSSVYDDAIEVHKDLTGQLREKIVKHEKLHSRNARYTKEDFMNDFNSSNSYFKDSLTFCIYHPESFIGFFPVMYSYYYKAITFNWSSTPPFLYFGAIFSVFWWLLFKVNPLQSIICYSLVIILINLILLVVTHIYVRKARKKGDKY